METSEQPVWYLDFLQSKFSHLRFKKLIGARDIPILSDNKYDIVDTETFFKEENSRIPIFINFFYGYSPKIESEHFDTLRGQYIASLSISPLMGKPCGLKIHFVGKEGLKSVETFV